MSEKTPRPPASDVMRAWESLLPGEDLSGLGIGAQVGRLHVLTTRLLNSLGEAHSVNSIDISILMAIRRLSQERPTRPTELWRLFDLTPGAITYRINRLSDLGLVERSADPTDGRAILVALTEQGFTTIDSISRTFAAEGVRRMGAVAEVPGGAPMLGWLLDLLLQGWEAADDEAEG